MTQIAFLKAEHLPTNKQIQDTLQALGHDFQMLTPLEQQINDEGLECSINGHQTYFETYVSDAGKTLSEHDADWIRPDITDQNLAISFVWGADFAAGACIGLISIALIDKSNALIYYMDDQMKYSREMLAADTPLFLEDLRKENEDASHVEKERTNQSFWGMIKNIFRT